MSVISSISPGLFCGVGVKLSGTMNENLLFIGGSLKPICMNCSSKKIHSSFDSACSDFSHACKACGVSSGGIQGRPDETHPLINR